MIRGTKASHLPLLKHTRNRKSKTDQTQPFNTPLQRQVHQTPIASKLHPANLHLKNLVVKISLHLPVHHPYKPSIAAVSNINHNHAQKPSFQLSHCHPPLLVVDLSPPDLNYAILQTCSRDPALHFSLRDQTPHLCLQDQSAADRGTEW